MDIMIDLETLDVTPNAAVTAIGAVAFDRCIGGVVDTFEGRISFPDAVEGRSISADTVAWLCKQEDTVREYSLCGQEPLLSVLSGFVDFVTKCAHDATDGVNVWGNGAGFDITILESLLRAKDIPIPWEFYSARDLRTLVDVAGIDPRTIPFAEGVKHTALADALHEVAIAAAAFEVLNGGPS